MKISIESDGYFRGNDYEEGIKQMRRDGFTAMDYQGLCPVNNKFFQMSDAQFKEELTAFRKTAEDNGVEITQLHGLWVAPDRTRKQREESIKYFIKDIKGAEILGCKNVVIHPFLPFGWGAEIDKDKIWDTALEEFTALLPVAKDCGVTVCAENQPFTAIEISTVKAVKELVREIDDEHFKVCLDTGHANVFHDDLAADVRLLGDDLACMHVHDNKGNWDQHLIPYQGNIKWGEFLTALKEIGYKGAFNLETYVSPSTPEPMLSQMRKSVYSIAEYMVRQIEND